MTASALLRVSEAIGEERRLAQVAACTFSELGSKSQAVAALKRGDLSLNGERHAEGCRRICEGDTLSFQPPQPKALSGSKLDARCRFILHLNEQGLRCLHEDDDLAVVFKPAGIHTKSGQNPKFGALEDALPAILAPPAAADPLPLPLAMHRLDVRVSGLLLVAKTRRAALSLAQQFETRSVRKEYEALVIGAPRGGGQAGGLRIESPIEVEGALFDARSTLRTLETQPHPQWGCLAHVRLSPHTGRTHQLRVHSASIGTPIVGDDLYWAAAAEAREQLGMPPLPAIRKGGGLFLQSCAVEFDPPAAEGVQRIRVEVPAEPKFAALMERARRAAAYEADADGAGG